MLKNSADRNTSIVMVVFSYYPSDPRVRREAEKLVESGYLVDVVCLKGNSQIERETVNDVEVYRLPLQRTRGHKLRYLWEYFYFISLAFLTVSVLFIRKHYSIVHIHNMPDILVICSLLPRLFGSKVILDLHDPMPEVYMTKYQLSQSHPIIRLLCLIEKYSVRFSNLVLTPNIAFRDLFISRGCPEDKIHIVMNSPDETIFASCATDTNKCMTSDRQQFIIMYHGTIVERNGLDTALYAISRLRDKIPNCVFQVYGDGDYVEYFLDLVEELDLRQFVKYYSFVPLEEIANAIKKINLGLIPNKSSPFTEINLPTRIFEYLCMGKHVIAPKTKGILDYFDEQSLHFFEPGNTESLSNVIFEVYRNFAAYHALLERGITIYRAHAWREQRKQFLKLVASLLRTHNNQLLRSKMKGLS